MPKSIFERPRRNVRIELVAFRNHLPKLSFACRLLFLKRRASLSFAHGSHTSEVGVKVSHGCSNVGRNVDADVVSQVFREEFSHAGPIGINRKNLRNGAAE
jgi:hypothetical protein